MAEPTVYVCRVATPEWVKDFVTLLPPEACAKNGLPAHAIVGALSYPTVPGERITPDVFTRNRAFVDFMHQVIARRAPADPACRAEAARLGSGWMYLIDQRTPTPGGDVPAEDIVGAFEVKHGAVVAGSYRPGSEHRVLSHNGFFQLSPFLQGCLLEEMEAYEAT